MTVNTQRYINLCRTPSIHLATLMNYAKEYTTHFNTDMTIVTSDSSFPTNLCVIMSQCPLLATLLKSISHLMLDSPTILLPQFSSSSVKNLLDHLCSIFSRIATARRDFPLPMATLHDGQDSFLHFLQTKWPFVQT